MSDPQTNVQIEDVLSSIRRLVSEEIGQMPARKPVKVVEPEEDKRLVLSPSQKVEEPTKADPVDDLWEATQEMAPQEPAPVWWHREIEPEPAKPEDPFVLDADTMAAPAATDHDDVLQAEPEVAPVAAEPVTQDIEIPSEPTARPVSSLGSALAGLKAARNLQDDDWEPPEGEEDLEEGAQFGAMPWGGVEAKPAQVHAAEASIEAPIEPAEEPTELVTEAVDPIDEIPFRFRPGERLYERLSDKAMNDAPEEAPAFKHTSVEAQPEPAAMQAEQPAIEAPLSNEFDEDMLREMVSEIVRQELQGVLGERITRNVRKLVRREIQRTLSEYSQ